jgi:DNA-binding MarR family transcriptional regulator
MAAGTRSSERSKAGTVGRVAAAQRASAAKRARKTGEDPAASHAAGAPAKRDPAARVLRRFRTVFNAVRNHFRSLESTVGVSGAQVWALSQVAARPGMGVGQLARTMDIHQSTASNLVRALLEAGMVESERSSGDQRAVHLRATAKGLKLLAGAPAPFVGVLPEALRRLDPATLARLDRDLETLIRELRADAHGARVIIASEE